MSNYQDVLCKQRLMRDFTDKKVDWADINTIITYGV